MVKDGKCVGVKVCYIDFVMECSNLIVEIGV